MVRRFHFFSSLSSITSVTSSAATLRVAVIIGGGGSGGGRSGVLGTRSPERLWKSDGFIVRKESPLMPPANVEGDVEAHTLSAVCQRHAVAFVGWALMVPSWGSFLSGNPAWLSAMDVIVV